MPITAANVLDHARDLHPTLTKQHTPDPLAWRQLSRDVESLVQDITRIVPAFYALTVSLPFPPPSGFDAGWTLADYVGAAGYKDLLDFTAVWNNPNRRTQRMTFVPYEQRDLTTNHRFPAVTFRNGVVYPLGNQTDWTSIQSLTLSYTPIPTDITQPADVIPLQDDVREALAYSLAAFFAQRLVGSPAQVMTPDIASMLMQRASTERERFLSRIRQVAQKQRYRIRDEAGYRW